MSPEKSRQRADRISLAAVLVAVGYTVLRYPIAKGEAWDLVFLLNKATAFAGLILLAVALVGWLLRERSTARRVGRTGLALLVLHAALSVMVLRPAYFADLFTAGGTYSLVGGSVLLTGIASLLLLIDAQRDHADAKAEPVRAARIAGRKRLAVLLLAALHVGLLGWDGWWRPEAWPEWLPPITLLSAAVAVLALLARLARRRAKPASPPAA